MPDPVEKLFDQDKTMVLILDSYSEKGCEFRVLHLAANKYYFSGFFVHFNISLYNSNPLVP